MSIPKDGDNPFAPPKAAVLEAPPSEGDFIEEGRTVAAGRGISWYGEAWEIFKRAPGMWILIFIVFMAVSMLFAIIPLGGLVTSVCYPVVAAGLMLGCRDVEQGSKLEFGHLFKGFTQNTGSLLLVGVLYLVGAIIVGVIVGVGVAVALPSLMGGDMPSEPGIAMLMKVAPAFILILLVAAALMLPLIMALWFAPAIVIFHDVQPMAAMKASFKGCLRNFVPFLVYGIVGMVIFIVALIPFGLGLLVAVPLTWATMYTGYRDIFLDR
jgi:hypothetical protein